MDNFENVLQVVFVIIFLFGRLFLRLVTRAAAKPRKPAAPKPARADGAPSPKKSLPSLPGLASFRALAKPKRAPKGAPSLAKSAAEALASLELLKERARVLGNTLEYRGLTVLQRDSQLLLARIRQLIEQFETSQDSKELNRSLVEQYHAGVKLIEERLTSFENVVSERASSYSAQFNGADRVLHDVMTVYRRRLRGGEGLYNNLFGGVVLQQESILGAQFGVVVPQENLLRPRRWSTIVCALHSTVARQGRFATSVAAELGLPQAVNSMSYFLSTRRLIGAGLISSWTEWVYGDVAATMQLGDAHAMTLLDECERSSDIALLTGFTLSSKGMVSGMPLVARLVVTHGALAQLGGFQLDDFEQRVARLLEQYPDFSVEIEKQGTASIVGSTLHAGLFEVGAKLVDTPLSVLGSLSLRAVAGADFGPSATARLNDWAKQLTSGEPAAGARPAQLVVATILAIKKERNAESRIEAAALKSIDLQNPQKQHRRSPHRQHGGRPQVLSDVFCPANLPQTMMLSALSRSRRGRSSL